MRCFCATLAGVALSAAAVLAQQPPPAAAPLLDPANNRLDANLVRWEQAMTKIDTLQVQCTRTTVDKTFGVTDTYQGTAKYMKPNLAMLEMAKKDKPEIYEKYICSGTYLYEFSAQNREIRVHELPPPRPGQVAEDNMLSFLFGMKADEAKRRYDLRLVKEDQWYLYVEIVPRFPVDKADFQRARLVLNNKTFLPRELWFEQPNGNEVKWDLPRAESGVQLTRNDFTAPTPPPGWAMKRMPRVNNVAPGNNLPPRVVRPNQ